MSGPAISVEKGCTMLVHFDKAASGSEIKEALETGDGEAKRAAMRKAICALLNGEQLPALFITIVRYVLPSEDHTVQKLLLLYLEIIEKTDQAGKVLPEMILICQNLRNNLQHPNEYIRGCTLRFLCRLHEAEILEPLVPSVLACLEHRHSFVRRNAVLAVEAIFKLPNGDVMLGDTSEIIEKFLLTEADLSARRNAFKLLCNHFQDKAVDYLIQKLDQVPNWGDILQMTVLDLIRKVCRTTPAEKGKYIKIILALLQSPSASVIYECAGTLISLSTAPTAVRAAANCYCQLLISQSDNNVKLIVLDRLNELKEKQREIMQEMLMDVLRALVSPSLDVRRKVLDLALDLITTRNIDEVVMLLKKEVVKTQNKDVEKAGEYRQMLVQSIHGCAARFPDVAAQVVHLLMDFLGDASAASALDVAFFVREICQTNPKLREGVVRRLLDTFYQIRNARVCTTALWILGEYAESGAEVSESLSCLKAALGPLPFYSPPTADGAAADGGDAATASSPRHEEVRISRPRVLADGTYETQAAAAEMTKPAATTGDKNGLQPNLRELLLGGDFFVGGVTAATLSKLALKHESLGAPAELANRAKAQCLMYMTGMLRLGENPPPSTNGGAQQFSDDDSKSRIGMCIRALTSTDEVVRKVWVEDCRKAFSAMVTSKQAVEAEALASKEEPPLAQPDDLIDITHLKSRKGLSQIEYEDSIQSDISKAAGAQGDDDSKRLNRVLQLTGLSDPVYAEAYVTVHHYDIVLDVTVTNRSEETLQNLSLELATMGDLKLVERPQNYTLAPGGTRQVRANIKVSSTETGVIFGNIVYESTSNTDRAVVVLSDIHIDIMDYITPATCHDVAFRNMWAEFEWENKVAVNTQIRGVSEFLDHIVASTNMRCLTPPSALEGECGFLAANLYARSIFGEDALVNVSVEAAPDGRLAGYIRIRSKTQGIALSLGDKITIKQKGTAPTETAPAPAPAPAPVIEAEA